MRGRYRPIDHTGDAGLEAEAESEPDLYAACAEGLFDLLAPRAGIEPREACRIEVAAPDRALLLVRWLRELLYLHAVDRWMFIEFAIETGGGKDGGDFRLAAEARGERYDPARHRLRRELKAVTHHQASVVPGEDGIWRARVVFDM